MTLLRIGMLATHFLCMNLAAVGPVIGVLLCRQARRTNSPEGIVLADAISLHAVFALLAGILLGLLIGLLDYLNGRAGVGSILHLFWYKIWWGIAELLTSVTWMALFWLWLRQSLPKSGVARFGHATLAFLSLANLLYHFPPLLSAMSQVANGHVLLSEPVTAAAFRRISMTPEIMAQSAHFALASLAVSATYLLVLAAWLVSDPGPFCRLGARIALVATVLQVPVGLWLLVVSPAFVQQRLLSAVEWPSGAFLAGLLAAFYLLNLLGAIALGEYDLRLVRRSVVLMLVTVTCMTAALQAARR